MDKLNAAVIGIGAMGKSHARVYSDMDTTNLVAVCDTNKKIAQDVANNYKTNYYTNYKEMLKKEKIDAVSVAVPTIYHSKVAEEIIKNKISLLIEKPITSTIEEAEKLKKSAKKNNVKVMAGHIERFNPVVTKLKKLLSKNKLGKIYCVKATRMNPFPHRVIDVGVATDLGVHDIDVMLYLFNSKIKRVYAETARRIHSKHEDLLNALLRFENHILGILNINWLTPKKVRNLSVTGEKGMLSADYINQTLVHYTNKFTDDNFDYEKGPFRVIEGNTVNIKVKKEEPLKCELKSFAECITKNKEPLVGIDDGINAIKIAKKLVMSAKQNKVINL